MNYTKNLNHLITLTVEKQYSEIKQYLESLPISTKGSVFEYYLEHLFLHNGWKVKLTAKKGDAGADLLLYHHGNNRPDFIIQAKNWNKPLTTKQVASELTIFEDEGSEKYGCKQYQLFSIKGYVKAAYKYSKYNIKLNGWERVKELIDSYEKKKPEIPPLDLFSHNQIAFDKIKSMYNSDKRVCVAHATGTGKSYLIASVLQQYQNHKAIIVAPTHIILEELKDKFHYLMRNSKTMTYAKVATLQKSKSIECDLLILDEFHRAGASTWGAGVQNILDNNPQITVFGASATPYRYFEQRDMSNELFEGHVASDLSLPKAIARQILHMPKYIYGIYDLNEESDRIIENIDKAKILTTNQKNDYKKLLNKHKLDFERSEGMVKILKKHIKKDEKKFIIFCENKEHLNMMELDVQKWFRKAFPEAGTERYIVYSGSDYKTDDEITRFKKASGKKFHLLFSIDMLNEGLHVDNVNGVIMLRRTVSPRIFYQQIGRCIAAGGYDAPVVFDFVSNFNSIMATDFKSELSYEIDQEKKERKKDGLADIKIPVSIKDETKNIVEVFISIKSKINNYLPYDKCEAYALKLGLKDVDEWREHLKLNEKPVNIPANPDVVFREKGWKNWGTFLGSGNISTWEMKWLPFKEAREIIRGKNFQKKQDFLDYNNSKERISNIPANPQKTYKDTGWISFPDWIGTRPGFKREHYSTYNEAKKIISKLGLKNVASYNQFWRKNKPSNIPAKPDIIYKNKGWVSWGVFLGTGNVQNQKRKYLEFIEARKIVRALKLKSDKEWKKYSKSARPKNIPSVPSKIYARDWKSIQDWLGTKPGHVNKRKNFLEYREARKFVIKLELSSVNDWNNYASSDMMPDNIPKRPEHAYKNNGWINYYHWLGKKKRTIMSYSEAKKYIKKLNIKNSRDYSNYLKNNKS